MIDPDDELEYMAAIERAKEKERRFLLLAIVGIFACAITFWFVAGFVRYLLS